MSRDVCVCRETPVEREGWETKYNGGIGECDPEPTPRDSVCRICRHSQLLQGIAAQ